MKKRIPKKVRTAYHEAGHAVMYCVVEKKFKKVSIKSDEDALGRVLGYLSKMQPDIFWNCGARKKFEKDVMISMAGQAAECILVGRKNHAGYWRGGSAPDFESILTALDYLAGGPEDYDPYFKLLWYMTLRKLRHRRIWRAVELVTEGLLERTELTGKEVQELYRQATLPPKLHVEERPDGSVVIFPRPKS